MNEDKKEQLNKGSGEHDSFPESDPNFEDLKELKVEPFHDSEIFLDREEKKKESS